MDDDRLPLFPLKMVLLPRMPLPLRVFEERYRELIGRCLDERRPFGVVLIREGEEVGAGAVPESVGTEARIHAVQQIAGGHLIVLAVGGERFRLTECDADTYPYLVGEAEPVRDEPADASVLQPLAADVERLFREYAHSLLERAGVRTGIDYSLPDTPPDLSFAVAAAIDMSTAQRQSLLEMTDTSARLALELELLRGQIVRLAAEPRAAVHRATRLRAATVRDSVSRN